VTSGSATLWAPSVGDGSIITDGLYPLAFEAGPEPSPVAIVGAVTRQTIVAGRGLGGAVEAEMCVALIADHAITSWASRVGFGDVGVAVGAAGDEGVAVV
jgi:hypothetical protein